MYLMVLATNRIISGIMYSLCGVVRVLFVLSEFSFQEGLAVYTLSLAWFGLDMCKLM